MLTKKIRIITIIDMKNRLAVAFILMFVAVSQTFAADGYGFGWGQNDAFNINKNGVSTSFTAVKDSSMSFSINANNTGSSNVNFGVFTFDSNFNIVSETVYNDFGSSGGNVISQNFNAGDMVGFWVEVDGEKRYSVHEMNEKGRTQDGWWVTEDRDLVFGFETNSPVYGGKDKLDFLVNVTGQSPSGQPLPGVLATFAIAGVIGFVAKRRAGHKK